MRRHPKMAAMIGSVKIQVKPEELIEAIKQMRWKKGTGGKKGTGTFSFASCEGKESGLAIIHGKKYLSLH